MRFQENSFGKRLYKRVNLLLMEWTISPCLVILIFLKVCLPVMANGLGGLVVTRSLSEKTIAGQTLDVTLTLVKQNDVRVNALYLAETLPSEWTLNQVLESSGHYSSLGPANGVSGTLKFIWVEMPDFPCTVTYRVNVPSSEAGTCSFEGEIGWAETSDPVYSSTGGDLSVEVEPEIGRASCRERV